MLDYTKKLKELRKCLRLWETEQISNQYGLKTYADSAIQRLKCDIEHVEKLGKPWLNK